MEAHKEIKHELNWHNDGKFTATIINGSITELHFCEPGTDEKGQRCLISTDYKYLKSVHEALGELFAYIEKQDKERNHSFASPTSV